LNRITKVLRKGNSDKILAEEKGHEEFTKTDAKHFNYAQSWWKTQQSYWADVRLVWDDVFRTNNTIKLAGKVNGKQLYDQLFALGDQSVKEKWAPAKNKAEVRKIIDSYLTAGLQTAAIK
jgi:hypothetical protein